MPFASQLPASGTLPYKPIRSQATPICCKHVLMLTTCQSQATLLVGKPVSQRNNDSGRLNKTCQNLSSMSIIQNHHARRACVSGQHLSMPWSVPVLVLCTMSSPTSSSNCTSSYKWLSPYTLQGQSCQRQHTGDHVIAVAQTPQLQW